MSFSFILKFLPPFLLIILGLLMLFNKRFQIPNLKWYTFVIIGVVLLIMKLVNHLTSPN